MVLSRSLSYLLLPALAFLSLSARASPHSRTIPSTATLKLAVKINANGIKNIAAADRARAQIFLQGGASSSISAVNGGLDYTAVIGVGSPPTYYTLLVDTGSSNTWIGASKPYTVTSTSEDTGGQFYVAYGTSSSQSVSGEEYLDTVTLNSDLVITKQSIGVAENGSNAGLGGSIDGILGLGPVGLTQTSVSNAYEVPTVMDNLYSQKTISSEVLGVFFSPAPSDDATGELTFGGYDTSKITGSVNYVPITSTSPANAYWGIDQSISYGANGAVILTETAGIVDTGTTLIMIATDAFYRYQLATGAILDLTTGLLMISSNQYNNLLSLYYTIGGVSYELTPNGQIWPRSLNTAIGGTADAVYLIVSNLGSPTGSGVDFINGYFFLQRFYSVFDTTNSQVGFATTAYTNATSN
ncbi:acid protease [Rhizopogon vinicolor AM-OR11-026]|uniref:Acid protease n=1 Tax=Rhizopogon vinicolor AM-OR11-026 TaxID=1314800 RepID=A0A1B7NFY0_9AGAM|nr:acid protease [Rhizopogon vinicolor AM-OR11-026]